MSRSATALRTFLGSVMCGLRLHRWQSSRLWDGHLGVVTVYMDGDMCARCGKVKDARDMWSSATLVRSHGGVIKINERAVL